ncbi:hypothetical protein ABEU20_000647 [Rhodococcus sp. PAM 2766]|uniref:Uncharacterized protein n=1 Tax=Rhodococcus parequi TaxID=3137122 RepID=A0ABW9FA61_9NOCA
MAGSADGVEADLDVLFAMVAALRALADDPRRNADPGRVYTLAVEWGTMMAGRFPRLHYYFERGALTDDQRRRYGDLLAQLDAVTDLVDRFGLSRPVIR